MPMATSPDAIETSRVPQGALQGRCLVIIGGTRGLGWSAAQACLREGARLVVVGREPTPEVPQTEEVQSRLEVILADAREPGVAERAIERCAQRYGQFHALYHVAGGSGRAWGDGPLHTIPLEGWQQTLELNLTTAFLSNGAAIRWFLRENQLFDGAQLRSLTKAQRREIVSGIDLSQPVRVRTLEAGTELLQDVRVGGHAGPWFRQPDTSGSQVGLWSSGRQTIQYRNTLPTQVLESRARPIMDVWTRPGFSVPTEGGGIQYYTFQRYKIWPK